MAVSPTSEPCGSRLATRILEGSYVYMLAMVIEEDSHGLDLTYCAFDRDLVSLGRHAEQEDARRDPTTLG